MTVSVDPLLIPLLIPGRSTREDVRRALLRGAAGLALSDAPGGDATADRVDHGLCHGPGVLSGSRQARFTTSGDHALADTPGHFDLDKLLDSGQSLEPGPLPAGEQTVTGVEGAACLYRAGHSHPAAPEQILLDAAPADIERVTSETNNMEGIHDRRRVDAIAFDAPEVNQDY